MKHDQHAIVAMATKSLSDAIDRLKAAQEDCRYWTGVLAEHSLGADPVRVEAKIEVQPIPDEAFQYPRKVSRRHTKKLKYQGILENEGRAAIKAALTNHPGVMESHVLGSSRKRWIVNARSDCINEVHRRCPDVSLSAIGNFFNMDHSSIHHHLRRHEANHLNGAAA